MLTTFSLLLGRCFSTHPFFWNANRVFRFLSFLNYCRFICGRSLRRRALGRASAARRLRLARLVEPPFVPRKYLFRLMAKINFYKKTNGASDPCQLIKMGPPRSDCGRRSNRIRSPWRFRGLRRAPTGRLRSSRWHSRRRLAGCRAPARAAASCRPCR